MTIVQILCQNLKIFANPNTISGVQPTVHRSQIRSKEVERDEGFVVNCVTLSKTTGPESRSHINVSFSVKSQLLRKKNFYALAHRPSTVFGQIESQRYPGGRTVPRGDSKSTGGL